MMILGELLQLNIIIKFPIKKIDNEDDEFSEWDEDSEGMIKLNIGLQEIKWIRF